MNPFLRNPAVQSRSSDKQRSGWSLKGAEEGLSSRASWHLLGGAAGCQRSVAGGKCPPHPTCTVPSSHTWPCTQPYEGPRAEAHLSAPCALPCWLKGTESLPSGFRSLGPHLWVNCLLIFLWGLQVGKGPEAGWHKRSGGQEDLALEGTVRLSPGPPPGAQAAAVQHAGPSQGP